MLLLQLIAAAIFRKPILYKMISEGGNNRHYLFRLSNFKPAGTIPQPWIIKAMQQRFSFAQP
jgi:hypothetical protein